MTTAIKALVDTLPAERKARPTLAILGGGGYIGARLVTVLASKQASAAGRDKDTGTDNTDKDQKLIGLSQVAGLLNHNPHSPQPNARSSSSSDDLSDDTTASHDQDIATATVMVREEPASRFAYKQVIAMDLRYGGNRHEEGGVLYTADPRDLSAADVVLVITRNGDNVAGYVDYARPGQVRTQTISVHMHSLQERSAHLLCCLQLQAAAEKLLALCNSSNTAWAAQQCAVCTSCLCVC
jgi:hypothetical protein